jgi:hypothetical protein
LNEGKILNQGTLNGDSIVVKFDLKLSDSAVGIATGYGLDDGGVEVQVLIGSKKCIFSSSRPVLGPSKPPFQWVPGALSPGIKRLVREADHSPPASAEVKKTWIYTSTPPYVFMV